MVFSGPPSWLSVITEPTNLAALGEDAAFMYDALVSRLLLEVARPGTGSTYVFANDMIRDVVYTEAGDARRRLFHKRALEILETAKVSAAVLAYHALAAGLAEPGVRHSLAAGQEAVCLVALNGAIIHFERARQLLKRECSVARGSRRADANCIYNWPELMT